jgi:hypothetical protein
MGKVSLYRARYTPISKNHSNLWSKIEAIDLQGVLWELGMTEHFLAKEQRERRQANKLLRSGAGLRPGDPLSAARPTPRMQSNTRGRGRGGRGRGPGRVARVPVLADDAPGDRPPEDPEEDQGHEHGGAAAVAPPSPVQGHAVAGEIDESDGNMSDGDSELLDELFIALRGDEGGADGSHRHSEGHGVQSNTTLLIRPAGRPKPNKP